jgi:hypothetical protein
MMTFFPTTLSIHKNATRMTHYSKTTVTIIPIMMSGVMSGVVMPSVVVVIVVAPMKVSTMRKRFISIIGLRFYKILGIFRI